MKSKLLSLYLFVVVVLTSAVPALAQTSSVSPSPGASVFPSVAPAVAADSTSDFIAQVMAAIQNFGGLGTLIKVTTVIMLLIASMKVSFLKNLIWAKLGSFQNIAAPFLGLLAGVIGLFGHGSPVTLASIFAYLAAGVGASGVHELLDAVKNIPGIGAGYIAAINVIEKLLGGKDKPAAQPSAIEIENKDKVA